MKRSCPVIELVVLKCRIYSSYHNIYFDTVESRQDFIEALSVLDSDFEVLNCFHVFCFASDSAFIS